MSEDESDSAAEEFDMLDDDAKAEILALAKKFIRKRRKKLKPGRERGFRISSHKLQKAEAIANQEDVPARAKMREIEKIYRQAKSGSNKKKKPSRSDQYKKKGPPLDARLRSDRRGMKAAEKRNKKKSKEVMACTC
eukprot:jgi/Picre1/35725/NNA_003185.t1